MRRLLAGWLVRLGQRIARPTVTDVTAEFTDLVLPDPAGGKPLVVELRGADGSLWNISAFGGGGGATYRSDRVPPDDGPTPVPC